MPIGKNRGRVMEMPGGASALIAVHPSLLMRIPEAERKGVEYRLFVEDLRLAEPTVA